MFRIGELARRTGVSPELLRAWERRYGLLEPLRTGGGFRLYSADDEARVERMTQHLAHGVSAAEAARLAAAPPPTPQITAAELLDALLALDEGRVQSILDTLLAQLTPEGVVQEAVLPALREIGTLWERDLVSVAQEHFASNVIRGRLLGLARRWDQGGGPRALLACSPGELHDLPLIMFGLALRNRGWRILFLGADTPFETTASAAEALRPDLVVVSSSTVRGDAATRDALAPLAAGRRLALAGVWPDLPGLDAERLVGDPVAAADAVARR